MALRMGTAGEAGYRKGKPLWFLLNTPRAQQGNPMGPKRRKWQQWAWGKTKKPHLLLEDGKSSGPEGRAGWKEICNQP